MTPVPRIVPRVVSRNWRLKLAALGLAVFLWSLVRTEPTAGVNVFTVPVRAQVGDLGWMVDGDPDPSTVQVRLRGPTQELIRIARDGTTLRLPVDSVSTTDTLIDLRRDWVAIDGSSGVVVEDISPAAVRLTLQPTLSAVLPVQVVTRGELDPNLALAAPVGLNPQTVRVRGAAQRVRDLDSVRLEPLDLGDVSESGTYVLRVDTAGLAGLSIAPLSVNAGLRIEDVAERLLAEVPVQVEEPEGEGVAHSVSPTVIPVLLTGARTPVTGARAEEVRAIVPLTALQDLEPGQRRRVGIMLQGVPSLVRASPELDSVLVERVR